MLCSVESAVRLCLCFHLLSELVLKSGQLDRLPASFISAFIPLGTFTDEGLKNKTIKDWPLPTNRNIILYDIDWSSVSDRLWQHCFVYRRVWSKLLLRPSIKLLAQCIYVCVCTLVQSMLDICSYPRVCLGVFTKCLPQCANVCVCTYACATSRAMVPNLLVLTYDLFPWKQKKLGYRLCSMPAKRLASGCAQSALCLCLCLYMRISDSFQFSILIHFE